MKLRLAAFLLPVLVLIACGNPTTVPSPESTSSATVTPIGNGTPPPKATPTLAPTLEPSVTPSSSPSAQPSPTPAAASLLVEVTTEGGFIAPSARLGQLPDVVIDTDGNIYRADPNASGSTLIPQAVVMNVGQSGATQILAAVKAAGL